MSINGLVPGIYERNGEIYAVKMNRDSTRLYAKRLVDAARYRFEYDTGAVYRLYPEDRMSTTRAIAFMRRYRRCLNCGHVIKSAETMAKGIGPVCMKAFRQARSDDD